MDTLTNIDRAIDLARALSSHPSPTPIALVLNCEACMFVDSTFCDHIEAANGKN